MTGQTRLAREKRPGSRNSREVARKLLHIAASVAATAIVWGLPAWSARVICVAAAGVAYIVEFVRLRSPAAGRKFLETFGPLLRARETRDITGATTLATGFAITIVLFPPPIAAVGFLYAGLGDAAAALVGRRFGRHRMRCRKSLEGSLAFLLASLVAGWAAPNVAFPPAAMGAVAATLVEAVPLPTTVDNLVLPIVSAATIWIACGLLF